MSPFLTDALKTADLPGAMARGDVGWGDYVFARRNDPAFELACQEVDQVIRHALIIQLECRAAAGDRAAVKLLSSGLREIRESLRDDPGPAAELAGDGPGAELPHGPCRDCARGLVVSGIDRSGRWYEWLVRHDQAEGMEIGPPEGWEGSRVLIGFAVESTPERPGGIETDFEADPGELDGTPGRELGPTVAQIRATIAGERPADKPAEAPAGPIEMPGDWIPPDAERGLWRQMIRPAGDLCWRKTPGADDAG